MLSHPCGPPIEITSSVRTTQERLNGFSLSLVLGHFTKICQRIPILVQIGQKLRALFQDPHAFSSGNDWVRNHRVGNPQTIWLSWLPRESCREGAPASRATTRGNNPWLHHHTVRHHVHAKITDRTRL